MYHRFDKDIYTNEVNYFFTLQGPRFAAMNDLMTKSLEKKFGKKFKPIVIFSARPNRHYATDNFIVLNKMADKVESGIKDHVIYLQEYEDLNLEFIESPFIQEVSRQLFTKQDEIFVYPFTTSFLKAKEIPYRIIGPDPDMATEYDSKINQYKLFHELGVPCNKAQIFEDRDALLANVETLLPCYITAAFTSGGNESGLIFSEDMLMTFLSGLRSINFSNQFVVADIFEGLVLAPNVNAVVTDKDKTKVLVIADQILRGTRYLGNVYPSAIKPKHEKQIIEITTTIGNHLSRKGYRGLFGCDFLINKKGDLVVVDLNPRRQGGYVCNALALKSLDIELTDLELELSLGETSKLKSGYQKATHPKAWAHSKVKPYDPGQRIQMEGKKGKLSTIFSSDEGEYQGLFYEQNSIFIDGYIGHVAVTGDDAEAAHKRVTDISFELLKRGLS